MSKNSRHQKLLLVGGLAAYSYEVVMSFIKIVVIIVIIIIIDMWPDMPISAVLSQKL